MLYFPYRPKKIYNHANITSGNEYELLHQKEVGYLDFKWMREYGATWRTHSYFGVSALRGLSVAAITGHPDSPTTSML